MLHEMSESRYDCYDGENTKVEIEKYRPATDFVILGLLFEQSDSRSIKFTASYILQNTPIQDIYTFGISQTPSLISNPNAPDASKHTPP